MHEMLDWFNENNGHFKGGYSTAYAVAHSQTDTDDPINAFVVARDFVEKPKKQKEGDNRDDASWYFPAQIIYNAEIVEALPVFLQEQHRVDQDTGKIVDTKKVARGNVYVVKDACMSFPHHKPRNVERLLKIRVKYQIEGGFFGKLKTITEDIEGLKAHMFQHEIDHAHGINIAYGDGNRKKIPTEERFVGVTGEEVDDETEKQDAPQKESAEASEATK